MPLSTAHVVFDPDHVPDHNALAAQTNENTADIAECERTAWKGVAGGYAGLDSAGYIEGLIPTPYTAGSGAGLYGAGAAARFAGGTVTGPPTSGTFRRGDFVIAQDGGMFICIVDGVPGTWIVPVGMVDLGAYLLP